MTRPDSVIRYRLLSNLVEKVEHPFAINFFEKCYECKSGFGQNPFPFFNRRITTACFNCYIALDNVNFKPLREVCSFCKGLMERYYQCAPKIDLPMFIDYDHPPKDMRQFIGAWMRNYKIVL